MSKMGIVIAMTFAVSQASVQIVVEADSGHKAISPYIYGKNDGVYSNTSEASLTVMKDAGLRMMRSNGGNNASKYNWSRHLTSHPDWYNNVYGTNWDDVALRIQANLPECSGMFAFQLTGWAASNTNNNFDDWGYNQSQYWEGIGQNLAGGGVPNVSSGDPNKYLMPWPADSTAGILPHWFGQNGLGLDSNRFRYWNMDNEVEIWDGTHNDVYPTQPTAEEFLQKYVKVAVAVRQHFPGVKLVAPVSPSEWQWYVWKGALIDYKGKSVSWPEFFIWRLKEVQDSTGVRMLDVYDVHMYVGNVVPEQLVQQHRIWFDTTWDFVNSNGVRMADGYWNGDEKKQYFFERINRWLEEYFGPNHGIGLGATESAIMTESPNTNLSTIWYASMLGTFADHGVEVFTPWSWDVGQWEVLHLFAKKAHTTRVQSSSTLDSLVSAYTSISSQGDSMTVILVNRDLVNTQEVNLQINGFTMNTQVEKLELSNLGSQETFISEMNNALVQSSAEMNGNELSLTLPSKSVTAIRLTKSAPTLVNNARKSVYQVQNTADGILIQGTSGLEMIQVVDLNGQVVDYATVTYPATYLKPKVQGAFFLRIEKDSQVTFQLIQRIR